MEIKMGAILITKTAPIGLDEKKLKYWYRKFRLRLYKSYINDPDYPRESICFKTWSTAYTGDFCTFDRANLKIIKEKVSSRGKATRIIENNSEKWGRAIAVRYKHNGEYRWLIGGLAAL